MQTYSVGRIDEGIVDGDDFDIIVFDTGKIQSVGSDKLDVNLERSKKLLTHCGRQFCQCGQSR